jgi:hypothetical protein
MSDTIGAKTAIERIERAFARIEAALSRPAPSRDIAGAEFIARHEALRGETRQALADLNRVIAQAGGQG